MLVAMALGWLLFSEEVTWRMVIATIVIVAGVCLIVSTKSEAPAKNRHPMTSGHGHRRRVLPSQSLPVPGMMDPRGQRHQESVMITKRMAPFQRILRGRCEQDYRVGPNEPTRDRASSSKSATSPYRSHSALVSLLPSGALARRGRTAQST